MLERVIENWLDKASEKSFQIPFCYYLIHNGYKIIHVSRHCGLELGKDIIAKSPEGEYCCYQLKSGKIGVKQWREINSQLFDLVTLPPVHPSIKTKSTHKSYLVTSGEIDEEVHRAINELNLGWENSGQKRFRLHTIVRGELLEEFKSLENRLWPTELTNVTGFLELFLIDGSDIIPREKFCTFLESILPIDPPKKPKKAECRRYLASSGLIMSILVSNFTESKNHVAQIKAWTIYISYILYILERWKLDKKYWKEEYQIAKTLIYNALQNLIDELKIRNHLIEGNPIVDQPFYYARITLVVSLISTFGLWKIQENEDNDDIYEFISKFCINNMKYLYPWGEGSIPQFLALFWFYRNIDPGYKPFGIIQELISLICKLNNSRDNIGLPNPYYEIKDILSQILGIADEPIEDTFVGSSYSLEALFQILVRHEWKKTAKTLWPSFSKLSVYSFRYKNKHDFFRWRNKEGTPVLKQIRPKQYWRSYQRQSKRINLKNIPDPIKKDPIILLLILIVYPFRMNTDVIKWLDDQFEPK